MFSKHTSVVLDTELRMQCVHLTFKYFIDIFDIIQCNFKGYAVGRK